MKNRIIYSVIILIAMLIGIHYYAFLIRNSALEIAEKNDAHQEIFYKAAIINNSGEFSNVVTFCSLILFAIIMYLIPKVKVYYRIPISLVMSVSFIVGVLLSYKSYFAW
jgi:hypothetical protein